MNEFKRKRVNVHPAFKPPKITKISPKISAITDALYNCTITDDTNSDDEPGVVVTPDVQKSFDCGKVEPKREKENDPGCFSSQGHHSSDVPCINGKCCIERASVDEQHNIGKPSKHDGVMGNEVEIKLHPERGVLPAVGANGTNQNRNKAESATKQMAQAYEEKLKLKFGRT